jgi:hypothetical protein
MNYWTDPKEEGPRLQRVRDCIKAHVNTSRLLFFVSKSFNDNSIVYLYEDGKVNPYWIQVEDKVPGSLTKLNFAELVVLGCEVKYKDDRIFIQMNQEQLAKRVFELVVDARGSPAVIGTVSGVECRVDWAYAQMKNSSVPEPEYMNLYGRSLSDGSRVVEKILP